MEKNIVRTLAFSLALAVLSSCGGDGGGGSVSGGSGIDSGIPTNAGPCPVPSSASAGGSNSSASGFVLNALSCAPIAGVKVTVNPLGEVTTGVDGSFKLNGALPETQYGITLTSPNTVMRNTFSSLGHAPRVFSVIPNSFDMRAFEEIARPTSFGLVRWIQAPILIVQKRVIDMSTGVVDTTIPVDLTNGGVADKSYLATQSFVSDDLVASAVGQLKDVLPQLTSFSAFKEVRIEVAEPGSRVTGFQRAGAIVIAWVTNIPHQGAAGMGLSSGYLTSRIPEIRAGTVFIDYQYAGNPIVLIHEFGHSLGYQHTERTASLMNPRNAPPPTDFDRQAARIAYDRSPGNKWPDNDPSP